MSELHLAHTVNLADERLGARALATNDDFFAPMHSLVKNEPAQFDPHAYTDRGKAMDGWESRRKRGPGHDWCVVALGCRGTVRLLDIDTSHFLGNHPPFSSVEAADTTDDAIETAVWREILPQSPLRPGSSNIFAARGGGPCTHLRLNIFPDGGVARLRAYGDVAPAKDTTRVDDEARAHVTEGEWDLAAVTNGGLALACSDAFFGPMNNLIMPGRAANMGGGWETRRRRAPGHDWIVIRLAAPGTVRLVELDTNHFKGNFPAAAALDGIMAPEAPLTQLVAPDTEWSSIVERVELRAHHRHFLRDEVRPGGPFSHVRLRIFPDGGISRLRVFGQ